MDLDELEKQYEAKCEHGNLERSCNRRCDNLRCKHRCAQHAWEGCRVDGCLCSEFEDTDETDYDEGYEEETE